MDESKLNELFRDAVPNVPPPSFDHSDIAAESRRLQVRRRNALLGGSALGVVLLVGATVVSVALWMGTDGESGTAASAPLNSGGSGNGEFAPNEVPSKDASRAARGEASDGSFPSESPKQGGTPSGNAGPSGPGSTPSGCEKADPELAAALAGELRVSPNPNHPVDISCPVGSRGVAFQVNGGTVSLVVAPGDAQFTNPLDGKPDNTALRPTVTADGRKVILISQSDVDAGQPPYLDDLEEIVRAVAAKI